MKSVKDSPEKMSEPIKEYSLYSLNEKNEHYLDIIEAAQDMIFIHDLEGKITYVNKASAVESGYSEEELLTMNVAQNVPPEYYPLMQELQIKRMQGNKEVLNYEMEFFKKNGERIPIRVSSSPIYKNDKLTGVIQIVRNISDLKKIERILNLQTELSSKLCQTNSLDSALDDVLNTALEIGDIDCGGIYILDEKTNDFKLEFSRNISEETLNFFQIVNGKSKFVKGPLFIKGNDFTKSISDEMIEILRKKEKLKFFSIIPFSHRGKPLGSLNIGSHEKDDIPELSKKILVALSQEIGGTIARLKSEELMKESENKYRQIVESANSIIFKFDKDGKILSMNEYGLSFFGYKKEEIIGKTVYETITPEYESTGRDLRSLAYKIHQEEEKYKINVNENIKKNGERVWIHWANKPIRDKEGNLTSVLAIGNDITAQTKLQEEIKYSELKFKTLFEKAYESILILDQDLFIQDANLASLELFHYPKEKIMGMSFYELIVPLESKRVNHIFKNRSYNQSIVFDTNFIKKTGGIFPAEINLTPLDIGTERSIICSIRDITEQKKKEDEYKKQILKYELNEGTLYLSKEPSNLLPFEAFRDLIHIGYKGILISRNEKDYFYIEDIDFEYFWLSTRNSPSTVSPIVDNLRKFISELNSKSVVLLDSIDYLIAKNGFNEIYNFITELREIAYFGNTIIILSLDKDTVDPKQIKLIEKETKPILPKSLDALNNRMIDIVRYILNQNKLGVNPSFSSIGKELEMTRPTIRKNVRFLEENKYVIVHRKGRNKKLELTDKGKKLL
ncbi:MAG: sensory histidine kinase AtoS [Candidatus Methanofastidiosum methylothiophilum]|uniref:Sensory histidine kinase AtoS n=1 Tax=Candidatus Methanofastidiosum methylothiophilum TaxID=1705564 RepID=A0A150IPH0_9EURY|nr:MAG: sensory histidine kinase AtoS [Candidatus Methanofastidiosum methylthiophilus]KYC46857.1 MAG: sensory histidine kinase AtoS [Candidatus Methanofastidiosum methylthiophilus]KYC49093.1 MAG: sensory histidine kinase AtoS [Candidatus Methanofastidiosum methylthiophilus]